MSIFLLDLFGSVSIGVYSLTTEKMAIVPPVLSKNKAKKLEGWLGVKVTRTMVGESVLIGAFAAANSNGIILPHFTREEEIKAVNRFVLKLTSLLWKQKERLMETWFSRTIREP